LLADGRAILIDRGWVPLDIDEPRAPEAAPPSGEVDVEGVLFSSEGDPPGAVGTASVRQLTLSHVDLAAIQSQLPYPNAPDYLLLQRQTPDQPSGLPLPSPLPELSEGPHLSYAVQWFTFAAIAVAGSVVVALRDGRDPREADDQPLG
jgi:surfeit locus 1 family protein